MTAGPTDITFEEGMTRLDAIVRQIEGGEVPIAQSIELVAEGKALERSLREYLDRCQEELSRVETDDGAARFRVIATSQRTPKGTSD